MVNAVRPLLGVFHMGEQGVPPGGTARSTWGNINHGFLHGLTMEESESTARTSTSPLWGLVAAVPLLRSFRASREQRCLRYGHLDSLRVYWLLLR